ASAVQSEVDEVDPADARAGVEGPSLREVADPGLCRPRAPAEHARLSGAQRLQSEYGLDQRRLARAVRAEHGHELALGDRQRDLAPDRLPAETRRRSLEADRRRPAG